MKRSQICIFTMKSNNKYFARFGDHSVTCAESHFCPTYDVIRPVLQWCDWLERLFAIFQFLLPIPKLMIKFNSRIVRTHFARIMIWNYQEILADMWSYISRWCSSCCQHCLCFKAPYFIVPTPWTLVVAKCCCGIKGLKVDVWGLALSWCCFLGQDISVQVVSLHPVV